MKVIVITGASSGIGWATAMRLASADTTLVLVARRRELLEDLAGRVRQVGGHAAVIDADLGAGEEIERLFALIQRDHGRVDVLINNAAFGYYGTVEHAPEQLVREIFDVNFIAPLLATQRVLPIMRAQGSGHIINVASIAGKRGLPSSGIYCATKFAMDGMSAALRVELRAAGIDVSVIYPVSTRTPFFKVARIGDGKGTFGPVGVEQSADAVARAIARCIRRPRAEVYPFAPSRALVWLNALAPSLVDRLITPYLKGRVEPGTGARVG